MKKPKWIRGKALQTVIALKTIRPGDEVQVWWDDTQRSRTSRTMKYKDMVVLKCPCAPRCAVPLDPYARGIEITGWRRLLTSKQ